MGALLNISGVCPLSHGNVRSDAIIVPSSSTHPPSLTIVVRQLGLWKGYLRDKSYGHTHIHGLTDACYGGHDHCTTTTNCLVRHWLYFYVMHNARYRKDHTCHFVCFNLGSSKVTKLKCAHMVLAANYCIMCCRWQKVKWCI